MACERARHARKRAGWTHWLAIFSAAVALPSVVPAEAVAAAPWQKLTLFRKIESDPESDFALTEDQGPWLVMAVTFTGPDAQRQARELVHELRTAYKLPAYTHRMHFDFREGTVGRGIDRYGAPLKMRYRVSETEEVGVLVGDYISADDPEGQKTLKKLRYAQPRCLDPNRQAEAAKAVPLSDWRSYLETKLVPEQSKRRGPMGHAFITSNPLLPDEYFKPKGVDKLVAAMNKPLKHSLLMCPGRYTVKVATFTGPVITNLGEPKPGDEKKLSGQLEEAETKAHTLCEALRAKGYEAYEFHDRYSSIVTVGSFESVGVPREDGKLEINPQVHAIMQTFGAEKAVGPGAEVASVGKPKVVGKIPLDVQPLPVEVPKLGIDTVSTR